MRRFVALLLIVPICAGFGCTGGTEPGLSPADAEAAAARIGNDHQVRYVITEELQLASLLMVPADNGSFSATGKTLDGTEYDILIEQEPGRVEYTWTNSRGKEGKGAFHY